MLKLKQREKNTSKIDIHISENGLWLLVKDTEYFISFKDFPWFQQATLAELYDVKLLNDFHLHWKTLDIDIELDSLNNLEKYPLKFKN